MRPFYYLRVIAATFTMPDARTFERREAPVSVVAGLTLTALTLGLIADPVNC